MPVTHIIPHLESITLGMSLCYHGIALYHCHVVTKRIGNKRAGINSSWPSSLSSFSSVSKIKASTNWTALSEHSINGHHFYSMIQLSW